MTEAGGEKVRLRWQWHSISTWVAVNAALGIWVYGIIHNGLLLLLAACCIPQTWAVAFLLFELSCLAIPLGATCPAWVARCISWSFSTAMEAVPVRVLFESAGSFKKGEKYVFGFEPHSVLPLTMFVFSRLAGAMPEALHNCRMLASSALFYMPIMRNLFWWSGVRPVGKKHMRELLRRGRSCVLCPGGVQECITMRKLHAVQDTAGATQYEGDEVIVLRKRKGFVKMALQEGAHLVPCFVFGQSALYHFWRPFIDGPGCNGKPLSWWPPIARKLGFLPMIAGGEWLTPLPRRVPSTVVIGQPIVLTKVDNPSDEQVQEVLDNFITAMQKLYNKHKAGCGYAGSTKLIVI